MVNIKTKNTDIETLRAIGIVFVLISHTYKIFPWFKFDTGGFSNLYNYFGWWTGVDLFFCVSGFIITKSLINEIPKNIKTKEFLVFSVPFWVKRIYRLWPSAWFWLTFTVIGSLFFNSSGVFGKTINGVMYQVYAMLNIANFYGYECTKTLSCGVNQVYWSLSLEEQFYWILPFVLFFLRSRSLILIMLLIIFSQLTLDRGGQFIGFIRTDAISIGVLIGIAYNKIWYSTLEPTFLKNKIYAWLCSLTLVLMLSLVGSWKTVTITFNTGVVAVISGIMVWICSYNQNYIFPGIKTLTNYLGSRSYSLYLSHIPAYYVTYEAVFRYNAHHNNSLYGIYSISWLFAMVLTFLFSEISFRCIENPLRISGKKISMILEEKIKNHDSI
ncbi:acyltransferase [Pantoea dispersa]|uniref:acyltransferase family protein n=1 Tax=Pantoea dispersa TaxID=59814 RepID=UPI0023A9BDB3|nr:acyltransferase [Pantoea dispersa]WEA07166.1 acyltransferase [Pantoea dispersa]